MRFKKFFSNDKYLGWLLAGIAFLVMFSWAMTDVKWIGPDEGMRYSVARYLYRHPFQLPRGETKAILNPYWGISYGFYPILSYMVSAVFMAVQGLFAPIFPTSRIAMIQAARMADVLFMTIAALLVVEIGKRLFPKNRGQRWLFTVLVIFLPEMLFLGSYVNTDSLALLSAAMILLSWVRYLDEGWTWKNCILLASGMGICFLSYYNAYGWILWSFFFFCATALLCTERKGAGRWKFWFGRGMAIFAIVFAIAGWWFIRNYLIYDGDILARNASTLCAEKYAMPDFKPSMRATPAKLGWSLKDLVLYQDPGWHHNWLVTVLVSFVGTFGNMFDLYMPETVSKLYLLFLFAGGAGVFLMLRAFCWKERRVYITRKRNDLETIKIKTIEADRAFSKKGIFNLAMLAAMITPVVVFMNYAYYNDNQAQGRYIASAVFPVMYFVTCGYGKILDRFVKNENVKKWFYRIASCLWVLGGVLTYLLVVVPAYR